MQLPPHVLGLRKALGPSVADDHFIARALEQPHDIASWLDRRYRRVFCSKRFDPEVGRLESLRRSLRTVDQFRTTDAEVQAAATLLRIARVRLFAPNEEHDKTSDFVLQGNRTIDVEVRCTFDPRWKVEATRIGQEISGRIEQAIKVDGLSVSISMRRVRDDAKKLLVDGKAQRRLAAQIREVAATRVWQEGDTVVILSRAGDVRAWRGDPCLSDAAVIVDLSHVPSQKGTCVTLSIRMHPPHESERILQALKAKGERKQRRGDRPWVVVLDTTWSTLWDVNRIRRAVLEYFSRTNGSMSAVVVQRRSYRPVDWANLSPLGDWEVRFESTTIENTSANVKHRLTSSESQMFEETDSKLFAGSQSA